MNEQIGFTTYQQERTNNNNGESSYFNAPQQRPHRSRRRSSIAAGPTLDVTPEYMAIERSSAYGDFAEFTNTAHLVPRRNSLTNRNQVDVEERFRQSFASMMEYQGQSISIQKLKDKFERRGSLPSTSNRSSIISGRSSEVIGSVVETTTKSGDDDALSQDFTGAEESSRSRAMPLTEVRQPVQRDRKKNSLERENIIESLVTFSCHTPCAVLEDLIKHELRLWEDHHESDKHSTDDSDEEDYEGESSHGSVSTLSSDEDEEKTKTGSVSVESALHASQGTLSGLETCRSTASFENKLLTERPSLPRSRKRQCALLFVDINGFTKLSTMLDVESLSKVINSYFDMIVGEVLSHGGDILKFAGDAFFAEWRVEEDDSILRGPEDLMQLNASISSSQELLLPSSPSHGLPAASACVWRAAKCAASIVNKFSDFQVPATGDSSFTPENSRPSEAMLNVHVGVGCGELVGLHVGDYREDDDEEEPSVGEDAHDDNEVELRREFLFLGQVIDQVRQI